MRAAAQGLSPRLVCKIALNAHVGGTSRDLVAPYAECSPGAASSSPGQPRCTSCFPGFFSARAAINCTACPTGWFQPGFGSSVCAPCAPGFPATRASRYVCGPLTWPEPCGVTTAQAAIPGIFRIRMDPTSQPCAAGLVSSSNGSIGCQRCAAGTLRTHLLAACRPCSRVA